MSDSIESNDFKAILCEEATMNTEQTMKIDEILDKDGKKDVMLLSQ